MTQAEITKKLGYSEKEVLLIVHADDMGLCHSENQATINAFEKGGINSSSIMITCPWAREAVDFAIKNQDLDIGLHLTFTCEWKNYKWGGILNQPELLDVEGYFYPKTDLVHSHATPEIIANEAKAQIEKSRKMGFDPSHLDSHMACLFKNEETIDLVIEIAEESEIPFFIPLSLLDQHLVGKYSKHPSPFAIPFAEGLFMDRGINPGNWEIWYLEKLKQLSPGLNTLLVHVGFDDEELQAICVDHPDFGSEWRERDLNFLLGDSFQRFLSSGQFRLTTWQEIKQAILS